MSQAAGLWMVWMTCSPFGDGYVLTWHVCCKQRYTSNMAAVSKEALHCTPNHHRWFCLLVAETLSHKLHACSTSHISLRVLVTTARTPHSSLQVTRMQAGSSSELRQSYRWRILNAATMQVGRDQQLAQVWRLVCAKLLSDSIDAVYNGCR